MSMFEDNKYRWRETYFVLFDAKKRPKLNNVVKTVAALNKRFNLIDRNDDGRGYFDSMTVVADDDFAALDICFTEGAEVLEQAASLIEDMKKADVEIQPPLPWDQIKRFDGRFDVLHFERVDEDADDESDEEMLDPSALLIVLGALARLTAGVAVDPQAGSFLTE